MGETTILKLPVRVVLDVVVTMYLALDVPFVTIKFVTIMPSIGKTIILAGSPLQPVHVTLRIAMDFRVHLLRNVKRAMKMEPFVVVLRDWTSS